MTERAETLLREAKGFLGSSDRKQKDADADKWAASERIYQAHEEEGVTQRAIARCLAVNVSTVSRQIDVWRRFGVARTQQSFAECYYEVQGSGPAEREEKAARAVLRRMPAEEIAEQYLSDPDVRRKVNRAQEIASEEYQRRGEEAERHSEEKFRETVGPDVADDLEFQQQLRDAEYELVRARGALAGFLKRTNALEADTPAMWVSACRGWLDDITEKLELARSLLDGADLDDALQKMLAGEA